MEASQNYATFASLATDLRYSSIAHIASIHGNLETLGYEILQLQHLNLRRGCHLDVTYIVVYIDYARYANRLAGIQRFRRFRKC